MQVLLVEPYFGGSHRVWAEGLVAASSHEVTLVTHEARFWTWRMKGSAPTLARAVADLAADGYRPDVVLVSGMVDVATLRTLLHDAIGRPPLAVYFHETQLTYPGSPGSDPDLSYAFLNWTSALAADAVYFNSEYHRDVFFEELPRLLGAFPDHRHNRMIAEVESRSGVLPVGLDLAWASGERSRGRTPLVLWSHRWEYDKGPELFADGVRAAAETHDFRLALAGERFAERPPALESLARDLADRVEVAEHLPRPEYESLLLAADIIVSTAHQEFFGISVVEAVAAGARPVLPRRLSYPWLIPSHHHDDVLYPPGRFTASLRAALDHPVTPDGLRESMATFDWTVVGPRYDAALEAL